jgi:hypothetical protein
MRLLKPRMHPPHERVSLGSSVQIYTFVVIRVTEVYHHYVAPHATVPS